MSNAVTLAVVVGCGSCFDVVVVSGGVCIADTSGMLGHRVFTSVHARLVHIDGSTFRKDLGATASCPSPSREEAGAGQACSHGMMSCKHASAIFFITGTLLLHPNTHK